MVDKKVKRNMMCGICGEMSTAYKVENNMAICKNCESERDEKN